MDKQIYVMVSTYFPTLKEPWRCSFVYDMVHAIQKTRRYEVVVVKPDSSDSYDFRGVHVVGFRSITKGGWLCPWLFGWINSKRMFRALVRDKIDIGRIAVAHGQLVPMATFLNALKKRCGSIKTVLQFQDPDPYGMLFGTGRLSWIKKPMWFVYHRNLVEKMDLLVGISNNVSRVIKEAPHQTVYDTYEPMIAAMNQLRHFRSIKDKRVYTLHNAVNHAIFNRSGLESHNGFVIGCVAVFRDWKDQLSLLRAVSLVKDQISDLKVKLVGVHHSGTMLEDCCKCIEENNLPVEIIPSFDHKELPNFYKSLDLFVLPSYFEGFGCVFTEAWNCGTPFITCEGQAMDDLIYPDDRKLWLCKERNPEDLAAKILYFYRNRPMQRLAAETDIDILVPQFLDQLAL